MQVTAQELIETVIEADLLDKKKKEILKNPSRFGTSYKGKFLPFEKVGKDIVCSDSGMVIYDSERDKWDDYEVRKAYRNK